jgi:uncharacterized protein
MKYIVITGVSSGIGYESAKAFAARGKNLIIIARRKEKLEELKSEIASFNPALDVVIMTADLSVAENAHDLYEKLRRYEIETWVNNAGFGNFASIANQNLDKIQTMLHLNIESLTILSSLYVRDYSNFDGAQLINVSSGGGYTIVADAVTYCATKFYVSAFTEGLARELQSQGAKLKAKVLAPAATETEFAKHALNKDDFQYEGAIPKYHTSKEMAGFLLDLHDSEKTVGIVDGLTYEFQLKDPLFNYAERSSNRD